MLYRNLSQYLKETYGEPVKKMKGLLTAPDWNPKKNEILQMIRDRMTEQGLRQGIFYETDQSLRKEGE